MKRTLISISIIAAILAGFVNPLLPQRIPTVHADPMSVAEVIASHTVDKVDVTVDGEHYAIVTLDCYINPETLERSEPSEPLSIYKVYVDAEGYPVPNQDTIFKIRTIERARHMQEVKIAYTVEDMPALIDERLALHHKIRLHNMVLDVLSETVGIMIVGAIAYNTPLALTKPGVMLAQDVILTLVSDPANVPYFLICSDFKTTKEEFNEFLRMDRDVPITDFDVACEYLKHLFTGWALMNPAMDALNELDEVDETFWEGLAEWGVDILWSTLWNFAGILDAVKIGALEEDLQYVIDYVRGSPILLVYLLEREESLSRVDSQLQCTLGTHGEYTLDLAARAASPTLVPDLTVTSVQHTPTVVETGNSITVFYTVKNRGNTPSGPFANRVFLSVPPYPWHTDIALGTFYMDSLAPGASQPCTVEVPIMPDVPSDDYYVTVYSDAFRTVEEEENLGLIYPNNIGSTCPQMLSVTVPPQIDLTIESVSAPPSAKLEDVIPVSFTATNLGVTSSGPFENRVFLSTSATGTEIALGEFDMDTLDGGASGTTIVNVAIPPVLPSNQYYVNVFADGLYLIGETDENNNIASTYPKRLAIQEHPSPVIAYSPSNVAFQPAVEGGYNPPSKFLIIWNSEDGDLEWSVSDDAAWLNLVPTSGVYTGSINSVAVSADISGMSVGSYTATITISATDAVSQTVPVTLTINPPSYPDLFISNLTVDDVSPYTGEQINVTATVSNQGSASSSTTNLNYYYSTNGVTREIYLGQNTVGSLGAGSLTMVSRSITIPDIASDQAYIIAVVNPTNSIPEENVNNNTRNAAITVRELDIEDPLISYLRLQWGQGPGNNDFKTGHEYTIVFSVTDNVQVDTLDFYYSINNGIDWLPIITNFVPGSNGMSGGYRWTIPADTPLTTEGKIRMTARDTSYNEASLTSAAFNIIEGTPPEITVLSPKGGEVWNLGSEHEIKWNASSSSGIQTLDIYLHYSDRVEFITEETVNDGSYSWTLPTSSNFVTETGKIKIRVVDGNYNQAEGFSEGYFSISDPSLPPPAPWTTPERITTVPSGDPTLKNHLNPSIAVYGDGTVHMVYKYEQDSGGATYPRVITQEILYRVFNGSSWSSPETVYSLSQETDSNLTGYMSIRDLRMALDGLGNPHVVWEESVGTGGIYSNFNEIYYSCRTGSSWQAPLNISNNSRVADFAWTTKSSLPEVKRYAACAVVSGNIYVMGGNYHLSNYQYNPSTNVWTRMADLPNNGVDEGGAAVVDGKIYVVSGFIDYEVMIYDPSSDTWSTGATMPTARRGMGVAAVDGKIYAIGGWESGDTKNEMYDPATDTWSTMADMPTGRGFASVAVVDNLIYVIGGITSSGGSRTNVVEVYDPVSNSWSTRCSMPTRRSGAAVGVVNNRIYVIGGFNGHSYLNVVQVYYPSRDIWACLNPVSTARSGAVGAVVDNKLYVIGGAAEMVSLDMVEEGTLQGVTDEDPTISIQPSIAIDASNNVHIVWRDGYSFNCDWSTNGFATIYCAKKEDSTGDWLPTSNLTEDWAGWPDIAADSMGNLHLVFTSGGGEIYYMAWNGVDWSIAQEIVASTGHYLLDIVSDTSNTLHLTWYNTFTDESSNFWQRILYSYFDGSIWTNPEEVSDRIPDHYHNYPSITTDSLGRPHIIWEDSTDGSVNYKRRSPLGWSDGIKLNLDSQYARDASSSIAMSSDDQLHVVWTNQYNGHSEVFHNHADISQDITPPKVTLITPIGGEVLLTGSSYNVCWNSLDDFATNTASLKYTIDNGSSHNEIATDIIDGGSFEWIVPDVISDQVQLCISVSDTSGNTGNATSEYFSIADGTVPAVNLISPNGGEVWMAGSQHDIEWEATDNEQVSSVDISYSIDDGSSWSMIAGNLSNTGSYTWTIPDMLASTYKVEVVAIDADNNQGNDTSDASFVVISDNNSPNVPNNPIPDDQATDISINTVLSWSGGDPDSGDIVTYDVYFGNTTDLLLISANQTEIAFDPGILDYHTLYLWNVVANDSNGSFVTSPVWSFWTEQEPVPASPSDLIANVISDTQIDLQWNDNSDNELGFKLERRVGANDTYGQLCTTGANVTSFSDTGLVEGIDYHYRVFAYGTSGNSTFTDEAQATTWMKPVSSFTTYSEEFLIGQVDHEITFNASSSFDPDGVIVSWDWDFGDLNSDTGELVEHIYTTAGNYTVNLTVTDNNGLTDISNGNLTIMEVGDANADGIVDSSDIIDEERILFGLDHPTAGADANSDGNITPTDITAIEHLVSPLATSSSNIVKLTGSDSNGDGPYVMISAPSEVYEGENFIAQVTIGNITDFDACSFDITFDNSVLWVKDVTAGNVSGTTIPVDLWSEISLGTVRVIQNVPETSGVSGSGYLAEIHFDVIGQYNTNSPIELFNGVLSNASAQEISATWGESMVEVIGLRIEILLEAGWNMVSVPVVTIDNSVSTVFPSVAAVFTWNTASKSYIVPSTIEPDTGYWVAVIEDGNITVSGVPLETWTTDIAAGWNMTGSVITSASIDDPNDDPDSSVQPFAYWWDPVSMTYILTTDIDPSKGYWVASVQDCTLTMP